MTSELAFIAALRRIASHPAARGLQDDTAVLEIGGETLILTHDAMVEGVHFLPGQDAADVAWKLVATNMSDLAAKGAEPVGVLLGYTLGSDDARFLEGLQAALDHYDAPLLGGDTVSGNGTQVLGLTAIGRATHRPVPGRDGAQYGDGLWITGPVGGAMIGFEHLRDHRDVPASETVAFRRPDALLRQGQALAPLVTAMMDVSDGLLLDASRLAKASGVTCDIHRMAVPIGAPEARRDDAMRWGDDYQLLFTAPADAVLPVPATLIGTIKHPGSNPLTLDGKDPSDAALGFEHR